LNLTASPPVIQAASQPEISNLTGAPLLQSNGNGDQVFVAFTTAPGGPLAIWNAISPDHFSTFTANDAATDIGAAADGTMFALQANGTTEIRSADLSLASRNSGTPANSRPRPSPRRGPPPERRSHLPALSYWPRW
jgi:hypothetical protein